MIDQWFSAHIPASFAGIVFLLAVIVTSNSSSEVVSLQPDDTRHPECEEEQQPAASIIKMQCDQSLCVTVSQNWTGRTRGWAVGTFYCVGFFRSYQTKWPPSVLVSAAHEAEVFQFSSSVFKKRRKGNDTQKTSNGNKNIALDGQFQRVLRQSGL